ncbi:TIGR03773 family transporter-associated surface protein [Curtobacterium sp. SP.BCo]|uniref:TIGR03773 family transporter-associated surface protein n=1 Tax=Curtobacterium sp. SP.BCo TaxID=3435229 RepID=UPI003F7323A2
MRRTTSALLSLGLVATLTAGVVAAGPAAAAPSSAPVVHDSGYLAVTPTFTLGADGKPTAARLGLVDKTDPASAAASWRPASEAVVHVPTPGQDGTWSLPASDADFGNGEQLVYGTDQPAAEYTARGGTLLGFDTQSQPGQLNGDLASKVAFDSAYRLEDATGAGWTVSRSDVDWDQDPPVRTIKPVWTADDHGADMLSAPGQYGVSPAWSFTQPGTYCLTIAETMRTKEPKGTPATDLSTRATYTVVVGAMPATVQPCAQPGDDDGDVPANLVTSGHHDLRTYLGPDGELHWGLDSALWSLDDVVIGRTPPPARVQAPTGATDMRTIGPVGTEYWYFPQSSTNGSGDYVWPGWSTESLDRSLMGSKVGISLDGVTRDGAVDPAARVLLLGATSGGRNSTYFDSAKGTTSFEIGGNDHSHNIWAFTKPGVYCVAMTATMRTASGHWTSATQNLTFAVGDDVDLQQVRPCGTADVPRLPSALPSPPSTGTVARLDHGSAQLGLGIDGSNVRSVATTGMRPTDAESVRDPEDVVLHGATLDGRSGQWRAVQNGGGAVAIRTDAVDPASVRDRHVTVGIGTVDGPGTVAAISDDGAKTYGSLSSAIGGSRTMDVPVRSTTRTLQWYFSKPGVYCVPLTYRATLTDGSTATGSDTLTFAVGPAADGSGIDLSRITTCSRGQHGVDLGGGGNGGSGGAGGGTGPSHGDVYLENGATNRAGATVLNDGHVDVASRLRNGALDTVVKDTTERATPTWRDTRKTVLQLLPTAKTTVPAGYGFLGAPGSPAWAVDQTQQDGLLWPGWSTESLPGGATKGGVTWALNDVQGYPDAQGRPTSVGDFTLYQQVGFGEPDVLLASAGKRSFVIGKDVHAHGSWSFSAEGVYCMAMTRSAVASDGSPMQHDFVLAVAVGNVSVQDVDPTTCFSGRTPTGSAAGTTTDDPSDDSGQAAAAPSLASMVDKLCTAPTRSSGAADTARTTVISRGHVDVGSRIVDGRLRTLVKDGSRGGVTWREPSATTIWLKPAAKVSSPGGAFSFLGAAGSPAWQIPQTQDPALVWLGWNTEEITAAQASSPVQWRLDSVDGPGTVTVYELAAFGSPERILSAGGTYPIPLGVHAHGNWGFTAEGTYRLHMTQTVALAGGGTSTDRQTLTVVVGGADPSAGAGSGAAAAATADLDCAPAFGSTVPAVADVDDPAADQGGGTTAGGIRPVQRDRAADGSGAPDTPTWVLAVIGFGGVLGAGGAGSTATWFLSRRRGPSA